MANEYVREIGIVEDIDGVPLDVGVDYDTVTVCDRKLARTQAEEFAQLFVAACWEAAANSERLKETADA